MRPERRVKILNWAVVLAGLSTLGMLAVGGFCLLQAHRLQLRLDLDYVGARAAQVLVPALERPQAVRALRPRIDALLRRAELGLNYLAVYDASGVLLASAGVFEHVDVPLVPDALQQRLRSVVYDWIGRSSSRRVFDGQQRLLGSIQFNIEPGAVDGVRVDAVRRLHWAGWMAALLVLPLAVLTVLLLRSRTRRLPVWAKRADPGRDEEGEDLDQAGISLLGLRSGVAMDSLGYALIVTDRGGRVRQLNATAERLTGWSGDDARGRLVYSVYRSVDSVGAALPNPIEVALRDGDARPPHGGYLRQRQGDTIPVEASVSVVRAAQGGIEGAALLFRDTSEQAREFATLRREVRLSQAVTDHLDEGLLTTDIAGVIRSANARAATMFAYSRDELVGFTVTKLMPVPFLNSPSVRITDYMTGRRSGHLPRVVGWRKDATTFPVELWVQEMRVDDSAGLVVIVRDISERLRGENLALRLGRLLDGASEEIYILDGQSLLFLEMNRGARSNLGYSDEEFARMTPLEISEDLDAEVFENYLSRLRDGQDEHIVYRCRQRRRDGTSYPVEVRINYSRNEEPPVFMAIASDITERVAAEEKLNQLAHFDALTGLPNRIVLHDRLEQARLAAQRGARLLGVMFLDLDKFKQINDVHGHDVGDAVLKSVASRLRSAVRPSDTVARLSGDEFVILTPGLQGPEDGERLAQKVLDRFAQPLDLPGLAITSRPSIGMTLYPLDDSDTEGLLRHADSAMYEAKQAGRGCYRMFAADVDPQRSRQLELERDLGTVLTLDRLSLRFLPALDGRQQPSAFVVEVRWHHEQHGWIDEQEFWRVAGRTGLIPDIELWQIRRTCELISQAAAAPWSPVPKIVAVSGWQLHNRRFATLVAELVERHGIARGQLVLAMTPDGLAQAGEHAEDLERLLALGVGFALRDFNVLPGETPVRLDYALAEHAALADADRLRDIVRAAGERTRVIGVAEDDGDLHRCRDTGVAAVAGLPVSAPVADDDLAQWNPPDRGEDRARRS